MPPNSFQIIMSQCNSFVLLGRNKRDLSTTTWRGEKQLQIMEHVMHARSLSSRELPWKAQDLLPVYWHLWFPRMGLVVGILVMVSGDARRSPVLTTLLLPGVASLMRAPCSRELTEPLFRKVPESSVQAGCETWLPMVEDTRSSYLTI
jgi:hypothetical protein